MKAASRAQWVTQVALMCLPALAWAQEAAPAAQQPGVVPSAPSGAHAEVSQPQLLVVADVAGDETANAQLRAQVYSLGLERGYAAAGKLDVRALALKHGLMQAGELASDDAGLERLRQAAEVGVLVRVARAAGEGGAARARVAVLSDAGVQATLLELGAPDLERRVVAAVAERLTAVEQPAPAAEAPEQSPAPAPAPQTAVLVSTGHRAEEEEVILPPHEAWRRRMGARLTGGFDLLATAMQWRNVSFEDTDPSGQPVTGSSDATGVGGGVRLHVGMMYLPPADPRLSSGFLMGFRLGVSAAGNVLLVRHPKEFAVDSTDSQIVYANHAVMVGVLPLEAGVHFGLGSFASDTSWRGAFVGLAYAPALQASFDMHNKERRAYFNPVGGELTIDIVTLTADSEQTGSEMQVRGAIFALFPLDDRRPGTLIGSLGAAWY